MANKFEESFLFKAESAKLPDRAIIPVIAEKMPVRKKLMLAMSKLWRTLVTVSSLS